MIDRFTGTIRGVRGHRTGLDSYLANMQRSGCSCSPKQDEAHKDFNSRLRGEVRGFLG